MTCNVAIKNSKYALPLWAIIAIASTATAILLCILISCCICCRNKRKENKKYNPESDVADPELWRQSQIEGKRKRIFPLLEPKRPSRRRQDDRRQRSSRRRRSTKERHLNDKQYTRSFHRSKRRSQRRRSSTPDSRYQRRRSSTRKYEHKDTHETLPDVEMQMLALPPPKSEVTIPALPAPHYASDQALYCDDEEINRPDPPQVRLALPAPDHATPDPPMLPGPDAAEQQQQQQPHGQMLMITDGQAIDPSSSGSYYGDESGVILEIENNPSGHNWDSSMFSDLLDESFGQVLQRRSSQTYSRRSSVDRSVFQRRGSQTYSRNSRSRRSSLDHSI